MTTCLVERQQRDDLRWPQFLALSLNPPSDFLSDFSGVLVTSGMTWNLQTNLIADDWSEVVQLHQEVTSICAITRLWLWLNAVSTVWQRWTITREELDRGREGNQSEGLASASLEKWVRHWQSPTVWLAARFSCVIKHLFNCNKCLSETHQQLFAFLFLLFSWNKG